MPRILINVSQEWVDRLQSVLPAAIDTLTGLEAQLQNVHLEGNIDPIDLIDQVASQLTDLKRSIQSVRIIF